jgi:DNA-directed RNA polymerase subunit M/transcription elongation factor TFIIS
MCICLGGAFGAADKFALAEEFSLDGPTVELRRVQFCPKCAKALVVTTIPNGARIRCPHCSTVQNRFPAEYLLTKVYQVCPRCGARMDLSHFAPGTLIQCGSCGCKQKILSEAAGVQPGGQGFLPDSPVVLPAGQKTGNENSAPPKDDPAPCVGTAETRYNNFVPPAQTDEFDSTGLRTAALVNGIAIPQADLELELTAAVEEVRMQLGRVALTPEGRDLLIEKEKSLRPKVLQSLVERQLVLDAAREEGYQPDETAVAEKAEEMRARTEGLGMAGLVRQARIDLIMDEMLKRHGELPSVISPAEIREYYEKNKQAYLQPATVELRGLVIFRNREERKDPRPAETIATDCRQALAAGADFNQIIWRCGEDPNAEQAGVLTFGDSREVPLEALAGSVRKALENRKLGEIVGPIELSTAIVFCQIINRRDAEPRPLAGEISANIRQYLEMQRRRETFEKWVALLKERADIRIK